MVIKMNVDKATINKLVFAAQKTKQNQRICLHKGPGELFHSMVVCEHCGFYFPPHRHVTPAKELESLNIPAKAEGLHIIRGDLAVFIFDDNGYVIERCVLAHHSDPFLTLIPAGAWHFTTPVSKLVVYHESKPGPFLGNADREFAPWAPARDAKEEEISNYVAALLVSR
jgi:cupin fold WbuC family metalloprotein